MQDTICKPLLYARSDSARRASKASRIQLTGRGHRYFRYCHTITPGGFTLLFEALVIRPGHRELVARGPHIDARRIRKHFNVQLMFARFGLSPEFLERFVIDLAARNRHVHEVLFRNEHDIDAVFEVEFVGMTNVLVMLDGLKAPRRESFRVQRAYARFSACA